MVVVVTCSVVVVVGSRIDYCKFDNEQLCINAKKCNTIFRWMEILAKNFSSLGK